MKINTKSKWANVSGLRRRVEGFWVYLLAAVGTLIDPIWMDEIMYKVLRGQFEEDE